MESRTRWIAGKIRLGWIFLALGALVVIIGLLAQIQFVDSAYNFRIVTGLGILFIGIGAGYLLRYRTALKDDQAARRLNAEERDERTLLIRARAGNRAYWVTAVILYIGLMWVSFSANGSLPTLSEDSLWFFLAAAVVIPFGVYAISMVIDQKSL